MAKRKEWDKEAMKKAIRAVRVKTMGYKSASKAFSVPRITLKGEGHIVEELVDKEIDRKPVLPQPLEDELVAYCIQMERSCYGLTVKYLRRMVYQLAIHNNVRHPFSDDQKAADRISIVHHQTQRIVALKGRREVHKSAERGSLVTVVMCMSVAGQYVPPMPIFPRKWMKAELLVGAPPGSIGAVNDSGWITSELFEQWFHHFVLNVKPLKEDPVVLMLDRHCSHVRNINLIDCARRHGVSVVCLPAHSTAKMQPLVIAFMFPFKTFYAQAIENWLSSNPGCIVINLQIARLFAEGYVRAATMETAVNGFCKTGILPYNPDIFREVDYVVHTQQEAQPGEVGVIEDPPERPSTSEQASRISPQQIRAVAVIQPSASKRRGSALLVSSSPHKNKMLEASVQRKAASRKRNVTPPSLPKKKNKDKYKQKSP
ncbi:hypothetical protein ANN_27791 [Periplaneta americana]|uniref:DDE-1 domain-containing protein n=1 Tax=Periplaneta americana TaxID=6978 RepID=A0ABQ8RVM0_PERAM|nr:hypothetical protein ANN_27791 [Periplaneta americana]